MRRTRNLHPLHDHELHDHELHDRELHDHEHGAEDDHDHPKHRRLHHSHAHAAVDQAMEQNREGIRALKVSLVGLGVTAALQAVVVVVTGSIALLSDTLHNVADALTALPIWLAFVIGRRRPTKRFTYGYGRAEDVAGLVVVLVIAATGVLAAVEALDRLHHPVAVRHVGAVMAAAVIGAAGNELVALYRIRVGRRIGSAALVADGLHARADGLTSLAVLVGAVGVALGWERADALAGLVIAAAIVAVLVQAAAGVGARMLDAVAPSLVEEAEAVVAATEGVEGVGEVRIRWIGHRLQAEARITVNRDLDVARAHAIAEEAHHALLHALPQLTSAIVHVDPCRHAGPDPHAVTAHHLAAGSTNGHAGARERDLRQSPEGPLAPA